MGSYIEMGMTDDSPLRVKPQQKRARDKVDAILAATARLLEREGLDAVNMVAISREAGLPPATTYHYFENRLSIFTALAECTMQNIDDHLEATLKETTVSGQFDWAAVLRSIYEAYRTAPGYRVVLPLLWATPGLKEMVIESNRRTAEVLASNIQELTKLSPQRMLRIARMITEAVHAFLDLALSADSESEADEWVAEMQEMIQCIYMHYKTHYKADAEGVAAS